VHIRNNTGADLLAVVSVDGVNVVSGQTASISQGGYVVGAWQSLSIQGWRKSMLASPPSISPTTAMPPHRPAG
jgi:hypothetical protein